MFFNATLSIVNRRNRYTNIQNKPKTTNKKTRENKSTPKLIQSYFVSTFVGAMNMGNSASNKMECPDNDVSISNGAGDQVGDQSMTSPNKSRYSWGFSKKNKRKHNNKQQQQPQQDGGTVDVNGHPKIVTSTSHTIDPNNYESQMNLHAPQALSTKSSNHPNNLPITPKRADTFGAQQSHQQHYAPFSPSYK